MYLNQCGRSLAPLQLLSLPPQYIQLCSHLHSNFHVGEVSKGTSRVTSSHRSTAKLHISAERLFYCL